MTIRRTSSVLAAVAALALWCCGVNALAYQRPSGAELPKPAQIPGVEPDVLLRAEVPNGPTKVLIVSRTLYKPGVHVAWHRHNSQIVSYILQGMMGVQDKNRASFTLKVGDSLLIKPNTVHQHWNASTTEPLVFLDVRRQNNWDS
jgi:quercetin dioxygenase-like cupin family protein